jgi:ribokinase
MITVVGSLNMDLLVDAPSLPQPGETVRGRSFRRSPGGKGANQACAVARMGMRCALIGAVGDDSFGEELLAGLRGDGIEVVAVMRRANTSSGVAMITVDAAGQNQIVLAAGANDTVSPLEIAHHGAILRESTAVIVQLEIPLDAVGEALRQAKQGRALTVLNPAPCAELSDELLRLCDWIIPNEIEASQLTGVVVRSADDAARAARRLRERSGGARIAVTLGAAGVWLESPEFSGLVPGLAVQAVDTVAAGDTFIGAFVTRLVEGAAPRDAARFAGAAAAISVTRPGAQAGIPRRGDVEAWLRER